MTNVAPCESCQAPIRWVVTVAGARMPLDFDPNPAGNVVAHRMAGGQVRARVLLESELATNQAQRWMPHHATCPRADAHRRRRASGPDRRETRGRAPELVDQGDAGEPAQLALWDAELRERAAPVPVRVERARRGAELARRTLSERTSHGRH